MISEYLKYGCSSKIPYGIDVPETTDLDYCNIKDTLHNLVTDSMYKVNPEGAVFQLSGGFDSSVVVSYFGGVNTFCTGDEDSADKIYSQLVSKEFNTDHTWISHKDLLDRIDFKKAIVEIAKINRHPRCFKNDFGLYAFLDYISNHTDTVVSGKGIEFQLLGYHTIYNRILEHAIARGGYSIGKAEQYLEMGYYESPKDMTPLNVFNAINSYKNEMKYNLDFVEWWTGTFTDNEILRLTGESPMIITFDTVGEIVNFIFEWFGSEYVDNRLIDFGSHFGVNCITPFIDKKLVEFIKTIPIELKKCINHHKYIFYQAMAYRVPNYVVGREKEGLNTAPEYFYAHSEDIGTLTKEYLMDKSMKIYSHIEYGEDILTDFNKMWSLLNLSIWMEHHDTSN